MNRSTTREERSSPSIHEFFALHPFFQVPRTLPVSKYIVSVSGHGGLVFKNSTNVEFNSKGTAVFIQTDKAMYKPGQIGESLKRIITISL